MYYNVIKYGQILGIFRDEEEALIFANARDAYVIITVDELFTNDEIIK